MSRWPLSFQFGLVYGVLFHATSRLNMSSLEIALAALLFFGMFPALWLLTAYLDRVWPSTSELDATRKREKPHEKLTVPEE
jgi:hypothetical protein